jgi:hypothetical protein
MFWSQKQHRPNFRLPPNNIFSSEVVGHYRLKLKAPFQIFLPPYETLESLWAWTFGRSPSCFWKNYGNFWEGKGRPQLPTSRTSTEHAPQWIDNGHKFQRRTLKVIQSYFFVSKTSASQTSMLQSIHIHAWFYFYMNHLKAIIWATPFWLIYDRIDFNIPLFPFCVLIYISHCLSPLRSTRIYIYSAMNEIFLPMKYLLLLCCFV